MKLNLKAKTYYPLYEASSVIKELLKIIHSYTLNAYTQGLCLRQKENFININRLQSMMNLPSQLAGHSLLQIHSSREESVMLGGVQGSEYLEGMALLEFWES